MRLRSLKNRACWPRLCYVLVIAAPLLACDPFEYVYFTNRAAGPVSLYEITRTPESLTPLAPGETRRRNWRYPIDATDLRRVRLDGRLDRSEVEGVMKGRAEVSDLDRF